MESKLAPHGRKLRITGRGTSGRAWTMAKVWKTSTNSRGHARLLMQTNRIVGVLGSLLEVQMRVRTVDATATLDRPRVTAPAIATSLAERTTSLRWKTWALMLSKWTLVQAPILPIFLSPSPFPCLPSALLLETPLLLPEIALLLGLAGQGSASRSSGKLRLTDRCESTGRLQTVGRVRKKGVSCGRQHVTWVERVIGIVLTGGGRRLKRRLGGRSGMQDIRKEMTEKRKDER